MAASTAVPTPDVEAMVSAAAALAQAVTRGGSSAARDIVLPNGMTAAGYMESQSQHAVAQAAQQAASQDPPQADPTEQLQALSLGEARVAPSLGLSGFWKVVRYRDLIQRSADATGASAAIMSALMEVEGSGESSVSPAGAMGLMQLMPDKFQIGDDPFDPPTNLLRAAQHIRLLQTRWQKPELVAAAYFGAIDPTGNVTATSDGNLSGIEYVQLFRAALERYGHGTINLPVWLTSPLGSISLTSEMISFGYLGQYGPALAQQIRGEHGIGRYGLHHLALDIQILGQPEGGRGTPIVAPFEGRIIRTVDSVGGPFGIWLESDKLNLRARLMHMDGLVNGIQTGARVRAGQQIGVLGAQGSEGFPHLHLAFERLSDGERINPALFYRLKDRTDSSTLAERWYDVLPAVLPTIIGQRSELLSDDHGRRGFRLYVTRWGPFELPEP